MRDVCNTPVILGVKEQVFSLAYWQVKRVSFPDEDGDDDVWKEVWHVSGWTNNSCFLSEAV